MAIETKPPEPPPPVSAADSQLAILQEMIAESHRKIAAARAKER